MKEKIGWVERVFYECIISPVMFIRKNLIILFLQTTFESGHLQLTTHRLIWDDEDQEVCVRV